MPRRGWIRSLLGGAVGLLGGAATAQAFVGRSSVAVEGCQRYPKAGFGLNANGELCYGEQLFLRHAEMQGCKIERRPDDSLALDGMESGFIRCLRPDAVVDLTAFSEIRNLRWEGRGKLIMTPGRPLHLRGIEVANDALIQLA